MKKSLVLIFSIIMSMGCIAYGAKYTINTSGTVKNQSGQIITSPANSVNQNYYNAAPVNIQQNAPLQYNQVNLNQYGAQTYTTPDNNYFNNYQSQQYISGNVVNSQNVGIVEFVMDYSGSMSNWIGVAKRSMSAILAQIPSTTNVGFRVFGHDNNGNNPTTLNTVKEVKKIIKKGNKFKVVTEKGCLGSTNGVCSATKQVAPILPININSLLYGMNSVNLGGATPLVYALDRAVNQDFSGLDTTTPKKIVLITDGGENCGGDPCAFAKKLMQKRSDVHIDVVLVSSSSKALACLSSTTGGHFYNAYNLSDFTNVVTQSMQAQPTIQPQNQDQKYEYIGE